MGIGPLLGPGAVVGRAFIQSVSIGRLTGSQGREGLKAWWWGLVVWDRPHWEGGYCSGWASFIGWPLPPVRLGVMSPEEAAVPGSVVKGFPNLFKVNSENQGTGPQLSSLLGSEHPAQQGAPSLILSLPF